MTKFKVGDKFIPRKPKAYKPKKSTFSLLWLPEMDIYDGVTFKVEKIITLGYLKAEGIDRIFDPDWCEKVEDEAVNFVQREGDVIPIEATLSTNATLTEGSKPFIIATTNHFEGIKYEEGTAKAPYEPYIPLSTKHIPEVRKMVTPEHLRLSLALAGIYTDERGADLTLRVLEKVQELGVNFTINDACEIKGKWEQDYQEISEK